MQTEVEAILTVVTGVVQIGIIGVVRSSTARVRPRVATTMLGARCGLLLLEALSSAPREERDVRRDFCARARLCRGLHRRRRIGSGERALVNVTDAPSVLTAGRRCRTGGGGGGNGGRDRLIHGGKAWKEETIIKA